jgi:hypothetical protein
MSSTLASGWALSVLIAACRIALTFCSASDRSDRRRRCLVRCCADVLAEAS